MIRIVLITKHVTWRLRQVLKIQSLAKSRVEFLSRSKQLIFFPPIEFLTTGSIFFQLITLKYFSLSSFSFCFYLTVFVLFLPLYLLLPFPLLTPMPLLLFLFQMRLGCWYQARPGRTHEGPGVQRSQKNIQVQKKAKL